MTPQAERRTVLVEILEHHRWANLRIIDGCHGLSEAQFDAGVVGTYGTIRQTLWHLAAAEEGYVASLTGEPPAAWLQIMDPPPDLALLRERLDGSGHRLIELAGQVVGDPLVEGTYVGRPFAIRASVFFTQAIDHATDHRSQVKVVLTQLGVDPPAVDGWAYSRESSDPS